MEYSGGNMAAIDREQKITVKNNAHTQKITFSIKAPFLKF